jgi:hypothetical protein
MTTQTPTPNHQTRAPVVADHTPWPVALHNRKPLRATTPDAVAERGLGQ